MRTRLLFVSLFLAAIGAAPVQSSEDAVVRTLVAQDRAVVDVGERLSVAALPLCRDHGWAPGIVIQTASQYGAGYRDAASRAFGVGDRPTISVVLPNGAGARAGLMAGDQILAIDGTATDVVRVAGSARVEDTTRALDALDAGLRDGAADLTIRRGGQTLTPRLVPPAACRARFEVRAGNDTNASATATTVQVSSDLVDPDRSDTDLAPLVAHELAHVILRHDAVLGRHRGGILPGFGKGGKTLRASEIEADRLSVYLLALAGYAPELAVDFWARFGRANDYGIFSDRTHPDWKSRVAAVREEVAHIAAQRAAGEPVRVPDRLRVTSLR